MTRITDNMIKICSEALSDWGAIEMSPAQIAALIAKDANLEAVLVGFYSGNEYGLDTQDRDSLFDSFARHVIGEDHWPLNMEKNAKVFEEKIHQAVSDGKIISFEGKTKAPVQPKISTGGMTPEFIADQLAATTKRTEKEQILVNAFMCGHREFFVGAQMAYDILITYGVQKVAEISEDDDSYDGLSFNDFVTLATKLRTRELTGHAARDAIHAAAQVCNVERWNKFYRRILLKDLKCGVDTSTINKVLAKLGPTNPEAITLRIPVFECQLAHDGGKPENAHRISGQKMMDIKLDGVRLLTVMDKAEGTVTQYTRNGKVNSNFTEICKGLRSLLDTLPGSVVLDGEVVSSSFQDLMTQINRKSNSDTSAARLAIFDMLPLEDFRAGICKTPQATRHAVISAMEMNGDFKQHTNGFVYVIPKLSVDLDTPEGYSSYKEFNKQTLEAGYEGVMLKDPMAPYELKRSYGWLKVKPFIEVSLEIIDCEEGKAETKNVGRLGAFVCAGEDDGKKIVVNCGSGFSDEQRIEFWQNRHKMIGMIIEVRGDALTLERGETVYSIRFPRFKGFRGTTPGEKI